jgi:PII-like signaling protein
VSNRGVSSEKIPITREPVDETQYIPRIIERIDGTTAEGGW